jgi:SP family arabinose:H+ symporter-like MFS transporter
MGRPAGSPASGGGADASAGRGRRDPIETHRMQPNAPSVAGGPGTPFLPETGSLTYFTILCFIAAIGGFLFGFDTAVISGVNPFLEKQFSLEKDDFMKGWIVASALLGCIGGSLLAGPLSDRHGRKKILVLSGLLFGLSGIGCALAPSPLIFTIPRFIGGVGVGVAGGIVPLYIAEISPAHLRGRMVTFYQLAITIGILLAYFSNYAFELFVEPTWGMEVWRGMIGSLSLPAAAFLVLLPLVPESPRWLTKGGREGEALGILARVAGRARAEAEMTEIRETIAEEAGDLGQLLRSPGLKKALFFAVFLACSAQLSGINSIIYYGTTILENAGFVLGKALGGQVVLGVVNVLFTVLALWKVDTFGRRPLMIWGSAGCFLSLAMVGILFASGVEVVGEKVIAAEWCRPWLIVFMGSYLACFAFSLGPLPWVIMSEVFPTRIRGRAMSIATVSLWSANTIVCFSFPWLLRNAGPSVTFWIFAALVFPAIVYAIRVMPETKGKSLEELERYFAGRA